MDVPKVLEAQRLWVTKAVGCMEEVSGKNVGIWR